MGLLQPPTNHPSGFPKLLAAILWLSCSSATHPTHTGRHCSSMRAAAMTGAVLLMLGLVAAARMTPASVQLALKEQGACRAEHEVQHACHACLHTPATPAATRHAAHDPPGACARSLRVPFWRR